MHQLPYRSFSENHASCYEKMGPPRASKAQIRHSRIFNDGFDVSILGPEPGTKM